MLTVIRSEKGETWFLGRQPIHVIMCGINYVPQASTDSISRDDHQRSSDSKLFISREFVEPEILDELGYRHRILPEFSWRVSLDPALTHADIETAVARSFLLRESRLRKRHRSFATPLTLPMQRLHEISSESGASKESIPSTPLTPKISRLRSLIGRTSSRSTGSSSI